MAVSHEMILIQSADLNFLYICGCSSLESETNKPSVNISGTKLSTDVEAMLGVKPNSSHSEDGTVCVGSSGEGNPLYKSPGSIYDFSGSFIVIPRQTMASL